MRLTEKRRTDLQDVVTTALRQRRLRQRDAIKLGGQLGFATTALFGKVGRVYASIISAHRGTWDYSVQNAVGWWRALLRIPLYHRNNFAQRRQVAVAWADGSWDMERGTGAIGAILLTPHKGRKSITAEIPESLCAELLQGNKVQRNTQSELLAVLVLLLSCPHELRGTDLLLYEDNKAAKDNLLSGGASDGHSCELVAAIWLLLAALQVYLRVEYVPSPSNPADAFSRPSEPEKRAEAAELTTALRLEPVAPAFPATITMGADLWVDAMEAAKEDWARADRRQTAAAAVKLKATDASTLVAQVEAVTFSADNKQIVLGWLQGRRRGTVAQATHFHGELLKLLCTAATPRLRGAQCTMVVLRKGHLPATPRGASPALATAVLRRGTAGQAACIWRTTGSWVLAEVLAPEDVAVSFYNVPVRSAAEKKAAARLLKLGFTLWG